MDGRERARASRQSLGGVFGWPSVEPRSRELAHGIEPAAYKLIMLPRIGLGRLGHQLERARSTKKHPSHQDQTEDKRTHDGNNAFSFDFEKPGNSDPQFVNREVRRGFRFPRWLS